MRKQFFCASLSTLFIFAQAGALPKDWDRTLSRGESPDAKRRTGGDRKRTSEAYRGCTLSEGARTYTQQTSRDKVLWDFSSWEKRVTVKTLQNGLKVILVDRPVAPVFSVVLQVDVGAAQDPIGHTGLAHMFEHMAFKGTDQIGTKDGPREKIALQNVEIAYQAYRQNGVGAEEPNQLARFQQTLQKAIEAAEPFVARNEYDKIIHQAGGIGSNAFTSADETVYEVSFPKNQFELWAYLESERIRNPVMREFYQERKVVKEERNLTIEGNPAGRLLERLLQTAFATHPYGRPILGLSADLDEISAADAQKFWETYYTPSNMILIIVGDLRASEALPVIEDYFGRLPQRKKPSSALPEEPIQQENRRVIIKQKAEPIYIATYHRGNDLDPYDAAYQVSSEILAGGRTSRLNRSLVHDLRLATVVDSSAATPGSKYPSLFMILIQPMVGHTAQEVRAALRKQIRYLQTKSVSETELEIAKTRLRLEFLEHLETNQSIALILGEAEKRYGDFREAFRMLDRIDRVTAADIQWIAKTILVDSNCTEGWIETIPGESS